MQTIFNKFLRNAEVILYFGGVGFKGHGHPKFMLAIFFSFNLVLFGCLFGDEREKFKIFLVILKYFDFVVGHLF
jgi:hypothetical protein